MRKLAAMVAIAATIGSTTSHRAVGADTHRIVMEDVAFSPADLKIRVGDVAEWVNRDIVAHTATAKDGSWDVDLAPGRTMRVTLGRAGTFDYDCRYHPNMTGRIVVEP